jgi:ribosomal protein S8
MKTSRFASCISLINAASKTHLQYIVLPTNKLIIVFLNLLKQHNIIYGWQYVSSQSRRNLQFPRTKIFLKYTDANTCLIKSIKLFKLTKSNFTSIYNDKFLKILKQNKLYFISTNKGCLLTSFDNMINKKIGNDGISGKILAEIFI